MLLSFLSVRINHLERKSGDETKINKKKFSCAFNKIAEEFRLSLTKSTLIHPKEGSKGYNVVLEMTESTKRFFQKI